MAYLETNEEDHEKYWTNTDAEAPTVPQKSLATLDEDDQRRKHPGTHNDPNHQTTALSYLPQRSQSSRHVESPSMPRAEHEESYEIALKRAERKRRNSQRKSRSSHNSEASSGPSVSSSGSAPTTRRKSRRKRDDLSISDRSSKADHHDMQNDIEQARAAARRNGRGRHPRGGDSASSGGRETRLTSLAAREKGVTGDDDTPIEVGAYQVSRRAPGQMPQWARPHMPNDSSVVSSSTGDAASSALTPYSYSSPITASTVFEDDRTEVTWVDASVSELIAPAPLLMEEASDKQPGCVSQRRMKVLSIVIFVFCLMGVAAIVWRRQIEFRKTQKQKGEQDTDTTTMFEYCDQNGTFALDSEVPRSARYSQLKSQIEFIWDFDESALFDGTVCSPHDLAITWLADADAMELNVSSLEDNGREIRQRLAMSLFYFSTNLPSSFLINQWLTNESECLWLGIICDEVGSVTKIELPGFGIEGPIPNLLFSLLPSLEALDLSENKLTGHIPISLYSTSSLVTLHLESNSLSGKIDKIPWTANTLEKIFLGGNDFTGAIPTSMASLTNLNELVCDSNDLTGTLPDTIFNLPSLKIIDFGSNKLTGHLPEVMSSTLVNINCAANMLNGTIPTGIHKLTNLDLLRLERNELTGSLSSLLANLVTLEYFELSSNRFTGSLPIELSMMSRLRIFEIGDNKITGTLFSGIGRLTNLDILQLEKNFISGPLLSEMGSLTSLSSLELSRNDLTGSIPESWGRLSNLQFVLLDGNNLSGSVPNSLCSGSSSHEFKVDPGVQCSCCQR